MVGLIRLTFQRARQERLPQLAGSLTFTTLLSLVPLVAVSFALFTRFPVFRRFEQALEQHLLRSLLPPEIARTVLRQLHQFAANASSLTLVGTLFLLAAAVVLLFTIESAFNRLWGVKRGRPWLQRLGLYLLVLALGPPVLGVCLWATSYVLGMSMGWLGALPSSARFVLNLGPALLIWAALSSLYVCVPHARVAWRHALVGGLLASVVLELGKRGFSAYLLGLPTYRTMYGAFAVLPVFLLWMYFSWLVTLAAALLTANLGRNGGRADQK